MKHSIAQKTNWLTLPLQVGVHQEQHCIGKKKTPCDQHWSGKGAHPPLQQNTLVWGAECSHTGIPELGQTHLITRHTPFTRSYLAASPIQVQFHFNSAGAISFFNFCFVFWAKYGPKYVPPRRGKFKVNWRAACKFEGRCLYYYSLACTHLWTPARKLMESTKRN